MKNRCKKLRRGRRAMPMPTKVAGGKRGKRGYSRPREKQRWQKEQTE